MRQKGRDRGGCVPRKTLPDVWCYSFVTFDQEEAARHGDSSIYTTYAIIRIRKHDFDHSLLVASHGTTLQTMPSSAFCFSAAATFILSASKVSASTL